MHPLHILFVSIVTSLFCSGLYAKNLLPVVALPGVSGAGISVQVRSENQVLPGARVLVETLQGSELFQSQTDQRGLSSLPIDDASLAARVTVTVFADGYNAVSLVDTTAQNLIFDLSKSPQDSYSILSGKLTGFRDRDSDEDRLVTGVVAKAFELADLVQLESSHFMSPLKDQIDLLGRRKIPSNLVFPEQTIPVYLVPIHLNKPSYRLPMPVGSSAHYFGATGSLNVEDAIGVIRQNSGWDLVNLIRFEKIGITKLVTAHSSKPQKLDLVADTEIRETIHLQVGRNSSEDDKVRRMVVALSEPISGVFLPTDVKLVQEDSVNLSAIHAASTRVLDLIFTTNGTRFRGAWANDRQIPDAGLSAQVEFENQNFWEGAWQVAGSQSAQWMVAHLELEQSTSLGGKRMVEPWVLVSPRRNVFTLPVAARGVLGTRARNLSHVSMDLLELVHGGYPFIQGELKATDLVALEKVRIVLK